MSKLIPHLLSLHSKVLEDQLVAEAQATGLSKSATARNAVDAGFAQVLELSRGQILALTKTDMPVAKLPRVGAHLSRQTDFSVAVFAKDLELPLWRVYSLAIQLGLDGIASASTELR